MRAALVLLFAPLFVKATDDTQGDDHDASDDLFADKGGESVCTRDTEMMEGVAPGERHAVTLGAITDCQKAHKGWPHHLGGWWNGHYKSRNVVNNVYGKTMGALKNHYVYSLGECKSKAEEHSSMNGDKVIAYAFSSSHNRCDVWTDGSSTKDTYDLVSHGVLGNNPYGWSDWCCTYWRTYKFCDAAPPTAPPTTANPTYYLDVQFGIDESLDHKDSPHSVAFPKSFNSDPVIMAGIPSFKGADFFTVRVKDVSANGFTMFGQESSCGANRGDNGVHTFPERVPWMAVETGRHTLPDGTVLEAGRVQMKDTERKNIVFSAPIKGAVILATIQTKVGGQPVFIRVNAKSDTGFTMQMQEDEGLDQLHLLETVGWVAIEAKSQGTVHSHSFSAVAVTLPEHIGEKGPADPRNWHDLGLTATTDDFSFGTFGFRGNNGAVLRTRGGKYIIQEDLCRDKERFHLAEATSLFVVRNGKATTSTGAGVSGDPFVVNPNGEKVQFFLPLAQEVNVLTCGKMQLFGRAFGSGIEGDHQQWFDQFRIVTDGREELKVTITKNATEIKDDADISIPQKDGKDVLSNLAVEVEGTPMLQAGAIGTEQAGLIAVWHQEASETVQYSLGSMVLQVKSAIAQKFDKAHTQKLYSHLDLRFVELKTSECTGGVLAEIWGVVTMSQATAAMLQPPQ